MQPVSYKWETALRQGVSAASPIVKVEIYSALGVLLATTDRAMSPYQQLLIRGGSVTVDATADVLRRATVSFQSTDGSLIPNSATHLLSNVSGNEVKIWRGLRYIDGTTELLPQGVFGFAEDETADTATALDLSISMYDRARRIRRAKFTRTYVVSKGANYVTAITALLQSRWSSVVVMSTATSFTTPYLVYDAGDDPWQRAQEMAAAIGYDLYFNPSGVCVLAPRPSYSIGSPSVFDYKEGVDATILSLRRKSSNENTFNGVIMVGASSSNVSPPRAEVWDIDPSSPTYSGYNPSTGSFASTPYGAVPYFETNEKLTTNAQCSAAATAKLNELTGRTEVVEFDAFVNAAHEQRDLVRVKRGRIKVDSKYELESFNISLSVTDKMQARTKERHLL